MIDYHQFDCVEHVTTLRYLITSNGGRQYRNQCIKCGCIVGKTSIKTSDLSILQVQSATEFDEQISRDFYANKSMLIKAAQDAEQTEKNIAWWAKYNAYLQSTEWKDKQRRVLDRDNHRCTARLPGCEAIASQAHHLTYDHVFNEPLFDLTSVCIRCHETITRFDRERRQR